MRVMTEAIVKVWPSGALQEVPWYAGQLEALGAWSGDMACKGCQTQSPDWGPETGNADGGDGTEGCSQ
jgi:hypothetical protein